MEGGGRAVEGGGGADRPRLGGFLAQLSLEGGEVMPRSIRNTAVACKPIFSVADPDPGSGAFLTHRFGIRIRDDQPRSYFRELRNQFFGLKLFDAGPGLKKGKTSRIRNTANFLYPIHNLFHVDVYLKPLRSQALAEDDWKKWSTFSILKRYNNKKNFQIDKD